MCYDITLIEVPVLRKVNKFESLNRSGINSPEIINLFFKKKKNLERLVLMYNLCDKLSFVVTDRLSDRINKFSDPVRPSKNDVAIFMCL